MLSTTSSLDKNDVSASGLNDSRWITTIKKLLGDAANIDEVDLSEIGAEFNMCCIHYKHRTRAIARRIVTSHRFETLIMTIVALNCVALACYDVEDESNPRNGVLEKIEYAFLGIFTLEAMLKIFSMGFFLDKGSYLRDGWNQLDFFIVTTGYLDIILMTLVDSDEAGGVKALRALRVLRALRIIQGTPSLQRVLESILLSIPHLSHVMILLAAIIVLYGIVGVELFGGKLGSRCRSNITGEYVDQRPCVSSGPGHHCGSFEVCDTSAPNPNDGITSFDNIAISSLTVFQCLTLEGWTEVWYFCNDAVGSEWPWIYFVSLVVFGSFFILNLVLGILSGQFRKADMRTAFRMQTAKARFRKARRVRNTATRDYKDWINSADDASKLAQIAKRGANSPPPCQNGFHRFEDPACAVCVSCGLCSGHFERCRLFGDTPRWEVGPCGCDAMPQIDESTDTPDPYYTEHVGGVCSRCLQCKRCSGEIEENIIDDDEEISGLIVLDEADKVLDLHDKQGRKPAAVRMFRHPVTVNVIMGLVFLNTVLIASDHAGQPDYWTETLRWANISFVIIFTGELLGKLWAFGPSLYWEYRFNRYDAFVVGVSVVELVITESTGVDSLGLGVLRCVRLLRLLRRTSWWRPLRALVSRLIEQIYIIGAMMLLLQLFIVIFALVGMSLFGGQFPEEARSNFNNFWWSYLAVFQVLTGENWNSVMNDAINVNGGINSPGALVTVYFLILTLLGNYIILNVFLAIAVDSLDVVLYAIKEVQAEKEAQKKKEREVQEAAAITGVENDDGGRTAVVASPNKNESKKREKDYGSSPIFVPHKAGFGPNDNEEGEEPSHEPMPLYTSLFCMSPTNKFRLLCDKIRTHKYFDPFILLVIVASSATLAAEDSYDPDNPRNDTLNYFDYVFTAIFTLELTIKVIALGFALHPGAYVRDGWNDLDLIVVTSSWLSIILDITGAADGNEGVLSLVRILRILRVLRPLRSVKRIPALRQVVMCLMAAVKNISGVAIITVMPIFLFGIIGVSLFKGSFRWCSADGYEEPPTSLEAPGYFPLSQCHGDYTYVNPVTNETETNQHIRYNVYMNFDQIGSGMLTLFAASTTEGWVGTLLNTIDAVGEDETMRRDNQPAAGVFLVLFMVLVAFFLLNLFIGFVIVTYQDAADEAFKGCVLDKGDRECVSYVLRSKIPNLFAPKPGAGKYRVWCYNFTSTDINPKFDFVIMGVIALNLVALMLRHNDGNGEYGMSEDWVLTLFILNVIFTVIFIVEATLKIIGFTARGYFYDPWNRFDFIIVVGSIVDVVCEALIISGNNSANIPGLTFLRLFRAFRLVKLLKQGKVRMLLNTFVQAFTELPYVVMLIMLLFFMFAVIGMQLFARVETDPDRAINADHNFQTFFGSLALLMRCSTGEDWQRIMEDLWLDPDKGECDLHPEDGHSSTCGGWWSIPFMLSFVIMATFIILNLFVAVICENFDYLTRDEAELGADGLVDFVRQWALIDTEQEGRMTHVQLKKVLMGLDAPFGLKGCPDFIVNQRLQQVNSPLYTDGAFNENGQQDPDKFYVKFRSTFMALVKVNKGGKSNDDIVYCPFFNDSDGCSKKFCRDRHACSSCGGLHSVVDCQIDVDEAADILAWKRWPNEALATTIRKYMDESEERIVEAFPTEKLQCIHEVHNRKVECCEPLFHSFQVSNGQWALEQANKRGFIVSAINQGMVPGDAYVKAEEIAAKQRQDCICMTSLGSLYSVLRLQRWWRRRYNRFKYECVECKHRFRTAQALQAHLHPNTDPRAHFVDRAGPHATKPDGSDGTVFVCDRAILSSFGKRMRHSCGKHYRTALALRECQIKHEQESLYCEPCGISFMPGPAASRRKDSDNRCLNDTAESLDTTVVCMQDMPCQLCLNRSVNALRQHTKQHQAETRWPLVCDIPGCGRRFVRRRGLEIHKQKHLDQDEMAIDSTLDKERRTSSALIRLNSRMGYDFVNDSRISERRASLRNNEIAHRESPPPQAGLHGFTSQQGSQPPARAQTNSIRSLTLNPTIENPVFDDSTVDEYGIHENDDGTLGI